MEQYTRIKFLKSLNKQADFSLTNMFVQSLSTMFEDIKQNPISGIAQLLTEGLIFAQFGWIGTILVLILDKGFNINIKTLFSKIKQYLIPTMEQNQGKPLNIDTASETISNQVLSSMNVSSTDANKAFQQVIDEKPELKAAGGLSNDNRIVKQAMFAGLLAKLSLKTLLPALIKALFIGAGFSFVGETVKETLGIGTPETKIDQNNLETPPKISQDTLLKYVGSPADYEEALKTYPNDADKNDQNGQSFYMISSGSFKTMINNLVFKLYPNMSKKVKKIVKDNINTVIASIEKEFQNWNKENINNDGTYIRVPSNISGRNLNSLKDIADLVLSMFRIS